MASNFERTVYIIELRDRVSMGMNRATAATSRFNRGMVTARTNTNMFSGALRGLAIGALAGVAYGLGRVTTQIIKMAAELESTTIAFEVMLRSATKAKSLVAYGMEFARTTPFTQRQTFSNMRQLLAYGAPEQNIRGYNRMLSTIAAGVGMERLPYLTLALGQVIAKGRLQGQELRQFTEHGVPVVGGLSKRLGISTQDVYERMRKGQISSQMVSETMMDMVRTGGLFEGMLKRLRESFTGTMNVMKSTWELALIAAVEPLMIGMKQWMESTINMAKIVYLMIPTMNALGEAFTNIFNPFKDLFNTLGALSGITGMQALTTFLKYLSTLMLNTFTVLETVITVGIETFKPLLHKVSQMYEAISTSDNLLEAAFRMKMATFTDEGGKGNISGKLAEIRKRYEGTFNMIWRSPGKSIPKTDISDPYSQMISLLSTAFGEGGEEGTAKKKRVANRLMGTGARDIVIHIGNLIENMSIATPSIGESADQLTERVKMAMLTAINDASILADR